jgi:hypothetical protein
MIAPSHLQDFDLEDLVHLEQTCVPCFFSPIFGHAGEREYLIRKKQYRFYSNGYEDGYKHGRLHGLIDGRALGAEKGFELWEELGFYEGTARLWTAIASTDTSGTDTCVLSSSQHSSQPVRLETRRS